MSAPDTTEAVHADAIAAGKASLPYFMIADRVIAADRKALAEQGYVIVKPTARSKAAWSNHLSQLYSILGKMKDDEALDYLRELGLQIEVTE